jgi:hypothetical protein
MGKKIDTLITDMVQSVEHQLPAELEESLAQKLAEASAARKGRKQRWWYSPALAAAVLFMALLMQPLIKTTTSADPPIEEIHTELEIKDKNIKIIWFQKKDFQLRRTNK